MRVLAGRPASPLGTLAHDLAYDTSVQGMPLDDVPLFTVRGTHP